MDLKKAEKTLKELEENSIKVKQVGKAVEKFKEIQEELESEVRRLKSPEGEKELKRILSVAVLNTQMQHDDRVNIDNIKTVVVNMLHDEDTLPVVRESLRRIVLEWRNDPSSLLFVMIFTQLAADAHFQAALIRGLRQQQIQRTGNMFRVWRVDKAKAVSGNLRTINGKVLDSSRTATTCARTSSSCR